jgi:hypothetical protein
MEQRYVQDKNKYARGAENVLFNHKAHKEGTPPAASLREQGGVTFVVNGFQKKETPYLDVSTGMKIYINH